MLIQSQKRPSPRPTPSHHTAPKYAIISANGGLAGRNPYSFNSATNATTIWSGTDSTAVIIYHKGQRMGAARLLDAVANGLLRRKEQP
jgi:hypothetical protein